MKELLLVLMICSINIGAADEIELPEVTENAPPPTARKTPLTLEPERWLDESIDEINCTCCNRDWCFCRTLLLLVCCCWCHEV